MANYVKFKRGLREDFDKLILPEADTLYFVYENENDDSAELYLGSKKIAGGDLSSDASLSNLKDIILLEIKNNDLLVYQNGSWINKSIEDIFANYIKQASPSVKIIINHNNANTHEDLIAEEEFNNPNMIIGSIIVIKDLIADNVYSHTGYVFDGEHWSAMAGNYNAENVYFNNDFIFTENVGTVEVPADIGNVTVEAKGKNLKQFLSTLFAEEKSPVVTEPSATIALGSNTTSYEVGSTYSPSYTITFNGGSYSYGPAYTNVQPTYSVSDTKGNISALVADTFDPFIIEDSITYKITAKIDYSQGDIPLTNLGNPDEDSRIKAGTLTAVSSKTVSGYRKSFYGVLNHKDEYSIRSLNSSTSALKNGSSFTINLKADTKRVVIAYPASLQNLSSVLDYNDSNANIVEGFGEPEIVAVEGANGYDAIDYKVYVLPFAEPYGTSNKFTVTI